MQKFSLYCWEGYESPEILGRFAEAHQLSTTVENLTSDAEAATRVIDGQTVLDYYGGVDESLALNCFYLFLFPLVFVILALLALSFIQHGSR